SYNVPMNIPVIQNCSLYLSGENLITLTRYKGLDPEFAAGTSPLYQGIDPCTVPQPRLLSLGIKLGL
ncbi:MAG: hypothetical protein GX619_05945, partial [Bacteroidales bacterium]|nr:hypothetical protein [Bacteroidales bacterium]